MAAAPQQRTIFYGSFNLDDELKRCAHAYLAALGAHGNDAKARMQAVKAVRPHLKPGPCRQQVYRWFGANPPTEANPGNPEFLRFIAEKQLDLREREELSESEIVRNTRRVFAHAVGDLPIQRSQVSRDEDGEWSVVDLAVREPSLPAANTALELMRKIGGFGVERTETRLSGVVGVANLAPEQREARLEGLARKAGLVLVPPAPRLQAPNDGDGAL